MEDTKGRYFVRIFAYIVGLLIMTLGVAISVKSNLGVSPVSSIPYTITCVAGLEMGKATIVFHAALVLIQILLLRKAFQAKNLLQIFAGILFGYFTTLCNSLMVYFPAPTNLIPRLAMMLAISKVIKKPFPTVKIAFDIGMVVISLITCLICLHSLGSGVPVTHKICTPIKDVNKKQILQKKYPFLTYLFRYFSAVCATIPITIPVTTPLTSRNGR